MKYIVYLFLICAPLFSLADTSVPTYITYFKKAGGPNGYNKVCQSWTGDNTGTLECELPGDIICDWVVVMQNSNGTSSTIDFSSLFDNIIESYLSDGGSSKIFQVGGFRIHAVIRDYYGNLEGKVDFYVYEV